MGWVVNVKHRPFYPRERPGTHCIRDWVGPRAGLDRCGKSRPTGIRSPDRPACSESLYRLRYPVYHSTLPKRPTNKTKNIIGTLHDTEHPLNYPAELLYILKYSLFEDNKQRAKHLMLYTATLS